MNFKNLVGVALALCGLAAGGAAQAADVLCGNASLGLRYTSVDPGLMGGLCYSQAGNLDNNFTNGPNSTKLFTIASGPTLQLIGKNNDSVTDALGSYTGNGAFLGNWNLNTNPNPWNTWNKVFLGFHFGNAGGAGTAGNPDSFIVELAPVDLSGKWALVNSTGGTSGISLNGLSNMYVFGNGTAPNCRGTNSCGGGGGGGGGGNVPEPGSLALVGLALLGAGFARKRSV